MSTANEENVFKKKKKFPVITKRIVTGIVLSGVILCSIVFIAGYWSFAKQFRKLYDTNICAISEAARECLNPDDFDKYLQTQKVDFAYDTVHRILQDFVDKFELNLLYVSKVDAPDYTKITYIYNPVKNGGKWTEFPLGYSENYIEKDYNTTAKRVLENGEVIVRHTYKTRSGSHITAMVPVYNSEGKIVAVLGSQKNIQEFVNARRSFSFFVIVIEIGFAILIVILFSSYFNIRFIKPILLITHETDHFASYGGEPSDRLLTIKKDDELGTLAHSVHQMEYDVYQNIKELTRVTAEKERIGTELRLASQIQNEMLHTQYPAYPERKDFDVYATMTPAKEVGGDLYDYKLIDDEHLMILVGDVSGKGVPAALFMGKCKVLLDMNAVQRKSPKEIMQETNNQLCKGNKTSLFVTCWLGLYTFSTGELRFVNAGHPYPILYKDGQYSYLKEKPNLILGGMENVEYTEHTINLHKGDRLFVYSDGVTEAINKAEQMFGEERLMDSMSQTSLLNAPDTIARVQSDLEKFVGNVEQFDDITMLEFNLN